MEIFAHSDFDFPSFIRINLVIVMVVVSIVVLANHSVQSDEIGTLKWKYKTGDSVYSSPAISSDGTIYVGSHDDHLYAINPDGTLKWKIERGD
ncbi:MAG: PQQ-binding-like beta-propeller repeat protein, partial [Candidatus Paceibacterota bacterium]